MSDRITALTIDRPHSEENPHNMAIYLRELIVAAQHLLDGYPITPMNKLGISGLLTVIEERASILSEVLDAPAFCGDWPETDRRLRCKEAHLSAFPSSVSPSALNEAGKARLGV